MNQEQIPWKHEYLNWKDIVITADPRPACVRVVAGGRYCWVPYRLSHRPDLTRWRELLNGVVDIWRRTKGGTQVKLDGNRLWVLCDMSHLSRLPGYRKILVKTILPRVNRMFKQHLRIMASRDSYLKQRKSETMRKLKLALTHA